MYFMKYINNILSLNLNLKFDLNVDKKVKNVKVVSDIETGNFEIDENYDIESCVYKNISNYISMLNEDKN